MFGAWYFCIACAIIFVISIIIIFKSNLSEILCYSLSISSGLAAIMFLATAIVIPIEADKTIEHYKNKQNNYILYADFLKDENSFKLENEERIRYYISEINEYNDWLKEAKKSQATQGCLSRYYNKDLSNFEYIFITQ